MSTHACRADTNEYRPDSYFIAANPSTERYLYSIPLPSASELSKIRSGSSNPASPTPLTDHSKLSTTGFYDVSFSPGAGFYLLEQKAGIPWQRVERVGDAKFDFPLTDNARLNETLAKYAMPKTTYKIIEANGVCESLMCIQGMWIQLIWYESHQCRRDASFELRRIWEYEIPCASATVWWAKLANGPESLQSRLVSISSL